MAADRIKRVITSRKLSLGLILATVGFMVISTLIPQEIRVSPAVLDSWRREHEALLWLVDGLSLHRIFAQPWFCAVILGAAVTLGISTRDQLVAALQRLRSPGSAAAEEVATDIPEELFHAVAGKHSYQPVATDCGDTVKYVRHRWGYFGNFLLHGGLVLVVVASLYVALTGRQGSVVLLQGEPRGLGEKCDFSEHGPLTSPLTLPGTIVLERTGIEAGAAGPKEVFSDLGITDGAGNRHRVAASINRIERFRGIRLYHGTEYGEVFNLTFSADGRRYRERIAAQQPVDADKAGYSDPMALSWSPLSLSVKYFADAERKSLLGDNPELVLRLTEGEREVARTVLKKGEAGVLGNYRVEFEGSQRWIKLILVEVGGMWVIFVGFAVIVTGGLVQYLTPPREMLGLREAHGRLRVRWRALSFREFYLDERDLLVTALQEGKGP